MRVEPRAPRRGLRVRPLARQHGVIDRDVERRPVHGEHATLAIDDLPRMVRIQRWFTSRFSACPQFASLGDRQVQDLPRAT